MSRTDRRLIRRYFGGNSYLKIFRKPLTRGNQINEIYAKQELVEEGYEVSNRLKSRANLVSRKIPNAWDDITINAVLEIPYTLIDQKG